MKFLNRPLFIIVSIYILANSFMLVNNGFYWDDWCLSSPEGISSINKGVGQTFQIPIITFIMDATSQPALLYHILTGLFEAFSIVLFFKSLLLLQFSKSNAFRISILFAVIPYYSAKITAVCFFYTLGFLIFILAVYFLIRFLAEKKTGFRILSLILFFLGFMLLPSTLIMALAITVVLPLVIRKLRLEFSYGFFKKVVGILITLADFILLPFIFWVFRIMFLKPTGVYAELGYREFSISSVVMAPINLLIAFIQNFIGLSSATEPLLASTMFSIVFLILFILLLLILRKHTVDKHSDDVYVLSAGIYLFIAGAFAYIMVGLMPLFEGYDSRHQILLRIGASLIIFFLLNQFRSDKVGQIMFMAVLAILMTANLNQQLRYQKSWFKQEALGQKFRAEPLLTSGTNFIVVDNLKEYNEYDINYAFYCYTGILRKSFGDQSRFAIDSKALVDMKNVNPESLVRNAFYHIKDGKDIFNFRYTLFVNPGSIPLSNIQSIKMLYSYYFDKNSFQASLDKILSIHVEDYKSYHY